MRATADAAFSDGWAHRKYRLQRVVGALGGTRHGLREQTCLPATPRVVGADEIQELAPRHGDEPALWIVRRIGGPAADHRAQSLLNGVLGRREVGSATDEDTQHSGYEFPKQAAERLGAARLAGHSVTVGGAVRNGLSSSHS